MSASAQPDEIAEADAAIRMALDQDASVEEASGSAGELLEQHGGIAAGLRFRPAELSPHAANV